MPDKKTVERLINPLKPRDLTNLGENIRRESFDKQQKIKEESRAIKAEQYSAEAQKYWARVMEKAKELQKGGVEAFYEWTTGMNKIAASLEYDMKAIRFTLLTLTAPLDLPGRLASFVKSKVFESYWVDQPEIHFTTDIDENGYFSSSVTKVYPKEEIASEEATPDQKEYFDISVVNWLRDEHGYRAQRDEGGLWFEDANGNVLTKDDYERLRSDQDSGLKAYLEGLFGLGFKEAPVPIP